MKRILKRQGTVNSLRLSGKRIFSPYQFEKWTKELVVLLAIILIIALTWRGLGVVAKRYYRAEKTTVLNQSNPIISIKYLQTILKEAGFYKGKIDGVCGPATSKAWNKYEAIYNQGFHRAMQSGD